MFDEQSRSQDICLESNDGAVRSLGIREILDRCSDLPTQIKSAEITYITERVIDKNELARLTSPRSSNQEKPELAALLLARRGALRAYLGSLLTCVFIRLPGVHYTIEIDPVSSSVIHWEWQRM